MPGMQAAVATVVLDLVKWLLQVSVFVSFPEQEPFVMLHMHNMMQPFLHSIS
jgi:hypothetical protein